MQNTLLRSKILSIYHRAKIITKWGAAFRDTSGEPAAVSVLRRSGLNYAANAKLSSTFIFSSDSFTGCYRLSPTCSFRPSSRRRNLSSPNIFLIIISAVISNSSGDISLCIAIRYHIAFIVSSSAFCEA